MLHKILCICRQNADNRGAAGENYDDDDGFGERHDMVDDEKGIAQGDEGEEGNGQRATSKDTNSLLSHESEDDIVLYLIGRTFDTIRIGQPKDDF